MNPDREAALWKTTVALFVLVILLALGSCGPAAAQPEVTIVPQPAPRLPCGDYTTTKETLTNLGETQVMRGLNLDGEVFEIWGSDRHSTWTALTVDANGRACLVDVGRTLEIKKMPMPGEDT